MLSTYTWPTFDAAPVPAAQPRVPVVVVGAGPVGLCAAIDLAQRGVPVLLLDQDDTVSIGSRGVCYAKRTLEIFDRLCIGQAVVDKGVTWNVGRTFVGDQEVFSFDLLPESGHRRPGMVNLQQYHLEAMLVERARALPTLELRFGHRVDRVEPGADGVALDVHTPHGAYTVQADWLIAADGARSPIRRQMGLDIEGKVFQDRFLIADVLLDGEPFPRERTERRFWFAPRFHAGESALMHRQADDVWRMDFQLGWQADPEAEKQPDRVTARVRQALDSQGFGHIRFQLEWVSVYTFQCRRMARFRHGRVLFVGDAAHQVSPFGARGANSGIQDADNLCWKLARVVAGTSPDTLLDSYDHERTQAADENIAASTRSTDFMTPKTHASRVLRDAVLGLAPHAPGVRALVNSGRLSVPTWLEGSPLSTPDEEPFDGWMRPGAPADDAPLADGRWLLQALNPDGFTLLLFVAGGADASTGADATDGRMGGGDAAVHAGRALADVDGLRTVPLPCDGPAAQRYDARPGTAVLLRPDHHVAARWRRPDPAAVQAAMRRACGLASG
jgi:3-(3-hydroxy-phenyl)propionate hydroxylase